MVFYTDITIWRATQYPIMYYILQNIFFYRRIINYGDYNYGFCSKCKKFESLKHFNGGKCCLEGTVTKTIFIKMQVVDQSLRDDEPTTLVVKHDSAAKLLGLEKSMLQEDLSETMKLKIAGLENRLCEFGVKKIGKYRIKIIYDSVIKF